MGVKIEVVNLRESVGDFKKYNFATQSAFRRTLLVFAERIRKEQYNILRSRVKNWTGWLGNAIMFKKRGKWTYWIGPMAYPVKKPEDVGTGERYEKYIESGTSEQLGHQPFGGYWYVKDSIRPHEKNFKAQIEKDIEKSQKK